MSKASRKQFSWLAVGFAAALLAGAPAAKAQSCTAMQVIPAPSGTAVFGQALALANDLLIVGSPATGEVYTFKRNGSGAYDQEGSPLVISAEGLPIMAVDLDAAGSTLVVGAAGVVRVYARNSGLNGWATPVVLTYSTTYSSEFGASVALEQDLLVVGAPGRSEVFVFHRNGGLWTQETKLIPPGLFTNDRLGESVSVSGSTVVVGAPGDNFGGLSLSNAGAAEVFVRTVGTGGVTWSHQAQLRVQKVEANDRFGARVAVEGDAVLVGAPLEDDLATDYGAVYAFERRAATWERRASLEGDRGYGGILALQGGVAVFGTPLAVPEGGSGPLGRISIFRRTPSLRFWSLAGQVAPAELTADSRFGFAVAVDQGTIAVGAPLQAPASSGAVYIFSAADCSICPD